MKATSAYRNESKFSESECYLAFIEQCGAFRIPRKLRGWEDHLLHTSGIFLLVYHNSSTLKWMHFWKWILEEVRDQG